jgi:uracil-DNA glycosylase
LTGDLFAAMATPADEKLPFVPFAGPTDPSGLRIALIGEAPGADEARMGTPFVGRAGQLLDDALRATGIVRGACLIGNVFRLRPPDNKVAHFFASRARAKKDGFAIADAWGPFNAQYVKAAYAGELDHLRESLVAYGPKVIVALGGTPLWALTGLSGITKERGRPLENRLLAGVPVVATWHPSFVLRGNRAEMPTMEADLRLALSLASG